MTTTWLTNGRDMLRQWRRVAGEAHVQLRQGLAAWRLWWLRQRLRRLKGGSIQRYFGYRVRITDGWNFYIQIKDEFLQHIYHFEAARPDPLIIDGGSNMGLSILYFKRLYPRARIVGFEPDSHIFELLRENVSQNHLTDVRLVKAGLAAKEGQLTFEPDGTAGGRIAEEKFALLSVPAVRLSSYLDEPLDFLKLNIEGQELPVLQEAAESGKLRNVREMVLEYHGGPGAPQRLGAILELLDRNGFRYLVHDFDAETGPASKPPFRLAGQSPWYCLVYAKQSGLIPEKDR